MRLEIVNEKKQELIVGKEYLVPCFNTGKFVIPILLHLHDDKENGQDDEHYHLDDRFEYYDCVNDSYHKVDIPVRIFPKEYNDATIILHPMVAIRETITTETPTIAIIESELNMRNLKNNKCPHKGFDLTNIIVDKNGFRKCPMHGLCTKRGKLSEHHKLLFIERKFNQISELIDEDADTMIKHDLTINNHYLYDDYKRLKKKIKRLKKKISFYE